MSGNLSKRVLFSITLTSSRGGITFLIGIILAKFMHVSEFGLYSYLVAIFLSIRVLVDASSTDAFLTFLSEKDRDIRYISYFFGWLLLQLLFTVSLIAALIALQLEELVFATEDLELIFLALLATFVQVSIWQAVVNMSESQKKTIAIQFIWLACVLMYAGSVILFATNSSIDIKTVFWTVIFFWCFSSIAGLYLYKPTRYETSTKIRTFVIDYWSYSKPLIILGLAGFLFEFFDRWMLQVWGGSVEQGYYSAAKLFLIPPTILSVSVLKIYWKEVVSLLSQKNHERFVTVYSTLCTLILLICSVYVGLIFPQLQYLISLLLNQTYIDGLLTFYVLLLYSIHQGIGQINSATFLAAKYTYDHSVIGILFVCLSLIAGYFLLAPVSSYVPGYELGSLGLVIRLLFLQIIFVNFTSYLLLRRFSYYHFEFRQFLVPILFIIIGCLLNTLIELFIDSGWKALVIFTVLYLIIAVYIIGVCWHLIFKPKEVLYLRKTIDWRKMIS